MRSIKRLGLAVLPALVVTAFLGTSSVMAEPTGLCETEVNEKEEIPCESVISHVHEQSLGHAVLLSIIDVECDVLFLGDVEEGTPLVITGTFTYTCLDNCTAVQTGSASVEVLMTGYELGSVTSSSLVRVECGSLKCNYDSEGLEGHALGPLLSGMTNGSIEIHEAPTNEEAPTSIFCPNVGELDILTEPLVETYIVWAMECKPRLYPPGHFHNYSYMLRECLDYAGVEQGTWVLTDWGPGEL